MKVPYIIGADLSKKSIDVACHSTHLHVKITNDQSGYEELMKWLKLQNIGTSEMMMVMEHTGLYSYRLEQYLYSKHIPFAKVSGLAIKRSMGLVRGKSDKQDAARIARYGFEKADQLVIAEPVSENLQRLQILHSLRERLVRNRASLLTAVKELLTCGKYEKGNEDYFKALEKLTGINRANFNEKVWALIKAS